MSGLGDAPRRRGGHEDGTHTRETVLQFGAGNFLRAFADLLIQQARDAGQDTGSVVIVQSTAGDRSERLNAQNGRYHVLVRGFRDGQLVDAVQHVDCISRALVAADDWDTARQVARKPELTYVVCNTTEAGYQLADGDSPDDCPPHSFPAWLLVLLRERHRAGLTGVSVLPCELLENNGDKLKGLVHEQLRRWRLSDAFQAWLDSACAFHNTLVDRIVSGMPAEHPLKERDRLLTVADPFLLWVIETRANQHPFIDHPNIRYVEDAEPYQVRKIRILNGAHTALVQRGIAMGIETVREAVAHEGVRPWLEALLFEEIVPTLAGRVEQPEWFARTALERFANPFVEHRLRDIGLHHAAKLAIRLVPTRDEYVRRFGQRPRLLDELLAEDPARV